MNEILIDQYKEFWNILSPDEAIIFALALNIKKSYGEKALLNCPAIVEETAANSSASITRKLLQQIKSADHNPSQINYNSFIKRTI